MTSADQRFAAKAALRDLRPYEPGLSAEALRRRIGGDHPIVKLGSNEGPWGPLPAAAAAIAAAISGLNRYPDGAFHELRSVIAAAQASDPERVVLGNGADSILINLSLALLEPGDEVVYGWPSFITYPISVRKVGAVPVGVPLDEHHRYDLDAMLAAVTDRTRLVYICNPNNPTGTYVDRLRLSAFVAALPEHVLCVIDEAYHEYVTVDDYPDGIVEFVTSPATRDNVLVLRTMSKIYGLAGLRIGWGIGPTSVVRSIDVVRGPFEMNALANVAAIASFAASHELAPRVQANEAGRARLEAALRDVGLHPIPSVANFVCVPLPDGLPGRTVSAALEEVGVIVRPLDGFGMPHGIRISVGSDADLDHAIASIAAVIPNLLAASSTR
ncbi:MAG: histidinol-phosphate transaminase [Thermoleophilia bacterium]|nr:histidinol-phosphate transaminase [Thermoleophilia bacterium]